MWTESDRDTGEGKVWYGPLDGRQAIHELTSGPRIYPGAVALSASTVYWSTCSRADDCAEAGGISRWSRDDSPHGVTISTAGRPTSIAADDNGLYWIEAQRIVKSDVSGDRVAETLVDGLSRPTRLVLEGGDLLWGEDVRSGPLVRSVSTSGGAPTTIVEADASKGLIGMRGLAADAAHVFWTDGTVVYRAPRAGGDAEVVELPDWVAIPGDWIAVDESALYVPVYPKDHAEPPGILRMTPK